MYSMRHGAHNGRSGIRSLSQFIDPDDEAQVSGAAPQPSIESHDLSPEQPGQGEVLGVVGLCPAELVRDLPGGPPQGGRIALSDRSVLKASKGGRRVL